MDAAKSNRWGHRDATMILIAYRHGLRVSELVDLRWDQIDFDHATLHVRRAKKGTPATHPIIGDEMRALRRLQREQDPKSPFVFTSERGSPFYYSGLCPASGARWRGGRARPQGAPAHAAPRLRLRAGQRRARYTRPAGLSRSQEHSAHGALHRVGAGSLQGLLALIGAAAAAAARAGADRGETEIASWFAGRHGLLDLDPKTTKLSPRYFSTVSDSR